MRQYTPRSQDKELTQSTHTQSTVNNTSSYASVIQQQHTTTTQDPTKQQQRNRSNINSIGYSPATTTQHHIDHLSDEINNRFLSLEEELKEQKQWNDDQ